MALSLDREFERNTKKTIARMVDAGHPHWSERSRFFGDLRHYNEHRQTFPHLNGPLDPRCDRWSFVDGDTREEAVAARDERRRAAAAAEEARVTSRIESQPPASRRVWVSWLEHAANRWAPFVAAARDVAEHLDIPEDRPVHIAGVNARVEVLEYAQLLYVAALDHCFESIRGADDPQAVLPLLEAVKRDARRVTREVSNLVDVVYGARYGDLPRVALTQVPILTAYLRMHCTRCSIRATEGLRHYLSPPSIEAPPHEPGAPNVVPEVDEEEEEDDDLAPADLGPAPIRGGNIYADVAESTQEAGPSSRSGDGGCSGRPRVQPGRGERRARGRLAREVNILLRESEPCIGIRVGGYLLRRSTVHRVRDDEDRRLLERAAARRRRAARQHARDVQLRREPDFHQAIPSREGRRLRRQAWFQRIRSDPFEDPAHPWWTGWCSPIIYRDYPRRRSHSINRNWEAHWDAEHRALFPNYRGPRDPAIFERLFDPN